MDKSRLAAGVRPAWPQVGVLLGWTLIVGGDLLTGLPASLDEELQTTLRKFRHQILQAMGGKGVPQGLTAQSFLHSQHRAPEPQDSTSGGGYAGLGGKK